MVNREEQLEQYRAARYQFIERIEAIRRVGEDAIENERDHLAFKLRYIKLDTLLKSFEQYHLKVTNLVSILSDDPASLDNEHKIRDSVDNNYYRIQTIYHEMFVNGEVPGLNQTMNITNDSASTSSSSRSRLPKLSLPKFSGDLTLWSNFLDLFTSLVDNDPGLSGIEKYQYLVNCLSDEPLSIVKAVSMSNDNYPIAFSNLKKRYNNKRLLATSFWNIIVNCPRVEREDVVKLRNLVNTFSENLAALDSLAFCVDQWDFPLFNILIDKIDSKTRTRFELEFSDQELPTYVDLHGFLVNQCKALETVNFSNLKMIDMKSKSTSPRVSSKSSLQTSLVSHNHAQCVLCNADHYLFKCPSFLEKTPYNRFLVVKNHKLCLNCLGASHDSKRCSSSNSCRICQKTHHTLLHFEGNTARSAAVTLVEKPIASTSSEVTQTLLAQASMSSTILLSTLEVHVKDVHGNFHKFRALLDNGSQASFISERCLHKLGLRCSPIRQSVNSIGGESQVHPRGQTLCVIQPAHIDGPQMMIEVFILKRICANMPTFSFSGDSWPHLSSLKLADPFFYRSSTVDILLSAEVFAKILCSGRIEGACNEPVAFNTTFGWILSGRIQCPSPLSTQINSFVASLSLPALSEHSLDNVLRSFWEIEEVPRLVTTSPEEEEAEECFTKSFSRSPGGRYTVLLPFRSNLTVSLGDSRYTALRRFYLLEKRLVKDSNLRLQYIAFMQDYLNSGHMSIAPPVLGRNTYYIPHHAVLKTDGSNSKLRVVFDASAKTSTGKSLNDLLHIGPKLQADIRVLLLRFRLHPVVFTADVRQMYRQILISPTQRDYQRILWRCSEQEPILEYQLNTVTYGVSCSPFLALRTLRQLCKDEESSFPLAASILSRDVYIDDVVTGCESSGQARILIQQLIGMLAKGGFELRKWASNCPSLLEDIPKSSHQLPLDFDEDSVIKILGLRWNPTKDVFTYCVTKLNPTCTKRSILSDLARIFDPLGFLSPLIFYAKRMMQHLWSLGVDWDHEPPSNLVERWSVFKSELSQMTSIEVPRLVIQSKLSQIELHGFCDASEMGYAAVIYVRVVSERQSVRTYLITAKSKVAPLKRVCIPRLELCAAVLLTDLVTFVCSTYTGSLSFNRIFAWSDSLVALSWIKSSPHRWKTFVSNRVSHIQDKISPHNWFHIRGKENPADIASRGCLPSEIKDNALWWAGPPWLSHVDLPISIVNSSNKTSDEALMEEKPWVFVASADTHPILDLLNKYSNLSTIQNIVAYIWRFMSFIEARSTRFKQSSADPIFRHFRQQTIVGRDESHHALLLIARLVQQSCFPNEYALIKNHKPCSKSFQRLSPFLDSMNMIRVGGRLVHARLAYDQKFPVVLPSRHRLTDLLIETFHKRYLHVGLKALQFLIVQQFWILSPKRAIRGVLAQCNRCFRVNPSSQLPVMGNLPTLRVSQTKPFSCVGVDFGGPFLITLGKSRGIKSQKSYLCLFVCFATKAVHLELASDLTSDCFLAALRRFISRRGRCQMIFSDCGTNFIGANRYIVGLMQSASEMEKIEWHFNPPSTPHFGGLWESGIKSVKFHLIRIIGDQILTYEEFYTVLVMIEAILNSRPLTEISSDPNDLSVLTPGHFLTLEPLTALPDGDLSHLQQNRLSRWQLLQKLQQSFWKRWHSEYLHTLTERSKWSSPDNHNGLHLNAIVLLKEDNLPPLRWKIGRVVELHPGTDGICRVVTVRTSTGNVKRPVVKLCALPH